MAFTCSPEGFAGSMVGWARKREREKGLKGTYASVVGAKNGTGRNTLVLIGECSCILLAPATCRHSPRLCITLFNYTLHPQLQVRKTVEDDGAPITSQGPTVQETVSIIEPQGQYRKYQFPNCRLFILFSPEPIRSLLISFWLRWVWDSSCRGKIKVRCAGWKTTSLKDSQRVSHSSETRTHAHTHSQGTASNGPTN